VITSNVAGTTVVSATSNIPVSGQSITRTTNTAVNTAAGGSGNAEKIWEGGGGQITPTQVDCEMYQSGTAPDLASVNYPSSGGKIGQGINPGVFFFWTEIVTTVPNQVVTVSQSNTSLNNTALFKIHAGYQRIYTGDCASWTTGTPNASNTGTSFTVATPGTYVIGIRYDVKSIAGTPVPVPADIIYNFTTSLGGTTNGSVPLVKK
jgi:hypothetical protein